MFADAGRGLAAAHDAGLVHRDFKPDNVMLGADGRVRVMDFGLARAEGEAGEEPGARVDASDIERSTGKYLLSGALTHTGALMGTPAYMASEQFKGSPADARSDQFGFCVALHEALYGQRPFAAESLAELLGVVHGGEVRAAARGSSVPTWLRKVVLRGLAPEPEARWPSMHELLAALADDPARRRRRWWGVAAVVALLGGASWALVSSVRSDASICVGMDEHLVGVWDAEQRGRVRAAIEGTALGYAATTVERVEQGLDAYTSAWVRAREQACEASARGEQSGELLDLRMACLDQRLDHVAAIVEVLADADETVASKAVQAVADLPGLDGCADVVALRAEIPPPEDPEVARGVAELDEQLVRAQALDKAGKYAEALELVDAGVARAEALAYEPLQVRAWLLQGELQGMTAEHEAAETTLRRAYASALGLGMIPEAASATRQLVWIVGGKLARHEDGQRWAEHAAPLARRVGSDDARARYLGAVGVLARRRGEYTEARAYLEEALALQLDNLGPDELGVAKYHMNLGNVYSNEASTPRPARSTSARWRSSRPSWDPSTRAWPARSSTWASPRPTRASSTRRGRCKSERERCSRPRWDPSTPASPAR